MSVDWGSVAAVVGAGLGSTGLAGLLTGGLQLSKRGRLRKSIARSQEVRALLPDGSQATAAVQKAVETDALRLAALTLVSFPKSTTWFLRFSYIYLVAATGVVFIAASVSVSATSGKSTPAPSPPQWVATVELLLAVAAFVVALVIALNALLRQRRDAFVALVESGTGIEDAVRRIGDRGPVSQLLRYYELAILGGSPRMQPIGWMAPVLEPVRLMRLARMRQRLERRRRRISSDPN